MANSTMKDKIDQLGDILIETFHVVGLSRF